MRVEVATSDDVSAVRQLTRDVARAAGLGPLEQTKLATAASELARRALLVAGGGDVSFGLDQLDPGAPRLAVVVTDAGPEITAASPESTSRRVPGLDMRSIRGLVETFDTGRDHGGGLRVAAAIGLAKGVGWDVEEVAGRVARVQLPVSSEALERRNVELADALTLLTAQSRELELANAELERVNDAREAVNRELALTNRGVLDLNAELERRADALATANESLAASAARHERMANQQAALAELGHLAVASRDVDELAREVVRILHRALDVSSCGVLRFTEDASHLLMVAADGCNADGIVEPLALRRAQQRLLRRGGALVMGLGAGPSDFPLPTPPDARSGAVVTVRTSRGPWGIVAACDPRPDFFASTATAFMEAAASLLAVSIARTRTEDAAVYASMHDPLTGLPNRAMLLEDLSAVLGGSSRSSSRRSTGSTAALVFIDLDGFKEVNDTLGHRAGDLVLVQSAARLRSRTRPDDTLARLGGDEFVVMCRVNDEAAAAAVAKRLIDAFEEPFLVDGIEIGLGASAGYALSVPGASASRLLADADIAMYRAKKTPGSAAVGFRPEMRGLAESEGRLHNELRRAVERGEIRAVYQPIVDLRDGTVAGVEALLRWRHPDLGDVPPLVAVAAAERIGLAWELTREVVGQSTAVISAWNAGHPEHQPLRLALNMIPALIDCEDRVAELLHLIEQAALPVDLVDLEFTETAAVDPTPELLRGVAELQGRGMRLAMDDFGTGYSSFLALSSLPFDQLKIDRSFVTPLDEPGNGLLVSAMTWISRGRGMQTVGEGIETRAQLAALLEAGCDFGQGYLFARPLERRQLMSLPEMERRFVQSIRAARGGTAGRHEPRPPSLVPVLAPPRAAADDRQRPQRSHLASAGGS